MWCSEVNIQRKRPVRSQLVFHKVDGVVGNHIAEITIGCIQLAVLEHRGVVVVAGTGGVHIPVLEPCLGRGGTADVPLTTEPAGVTVL